jgi:hypothetical protein
VSTMRGLSPLTTLLVAESILLLALFFVIVNGGEWRISRLEAAAGLRRTSNYQAFVAVVYGCRPERSCASSVGEKP